MNADTVYAMALLTVCNVSHILHSTLNTCMDWSIKQLPNKNWKNICYGCILIEIFNDKLKQARPASSMLTQHWSCRQRTHALAQKRISSEALYARGCACGRRWKSGQRCSNAGPPSSMVLYIYYIYTYSTYISPASCDGVCKPRLLFYKYFLVLHSRSDTQYWLRWRVLCYSSTSNLFSVCQGKVV